MKTKNSGREIRRRGEGVRVKMSEDVKWEGKRSRTGLLTQNRKHVILV